MTERRAQLKRVIIGGLIGLSLGGCFMLLIQGFRWSDALFGTLWLIPIPIVLGYLCMREKPE